MYSVIVLGFIGPPLLPVVGNFLDYKKRLKILGYHHLVWMNLYKLYGDVVGLKLGRTLVVTVFGAEAVREILNREEFDGRPDGFFFRMRTFGKRLGKLLSDQFTLLLLSFQILFKECLYFQKHVSHLSIAFIEMYNLKRRGRALPKFQVY